MSNNSITASYDSLPLLLRIIIQLIGGAVVGKKKGAKVTIETPAGEKEATILDFYKTK